MNFEEAALLGLGGWPPETVLLAAVSGGADSTAMLRALAPQSKARGLRFHCLHIEHGIRSPEESLGDAEAVQVLCKTLEVPCRVVSIPPGKIAETAGSRGLGIEAAARHYRHAAWNREAARIGAARILVAHTRDDLLETALMRFLRGAGPAGLAALPRERGRILRPLLELTRAQALRYLADQGVPFRKDSTNDDTAYLRNRIRLRLVPLLDECFAGWRSAVLAAAQTQSLTASFLAEEAERRIPWERGASGTALSVPRERFFAEGLILREEALFQALDALASAGSPSAAAPPRRTSIRRFARGECRALDAGGFCGGYRLEDRDGRVSAAGPGLPPDETGFLRLIKGPGRYKLAEIESGLVLEAAETGGWEANAPVNVSNEGFYGKFPLALRAAFPEDCIETKERRFSRAKVLDRARRSGYTSIISAEDSLGIAAMIGIGAKGAAVLARREMPESRPVQGLAFLEVIHNV